VRVGLKDRYIDPTISAFSPSLVVKPLALFQIKKRELISNDNKDGGGRAKQDAKAEHITDHMRRRLAPVTAELAGPAPRTAMAHGEARLFFQ
jgi:hypothetical protein